MKRFFIKVLELLFSERCAMVRKQRMDKRIAMQSMLDKTHRMRENGFYTTADMNIMMRNPMWYYNHQVYSDVPVHCRRVKVR